MSEQRPSDIRDSNSRDNDARTQGNRFARPLLERFMPMDASGRYREHFEALRLVRDFLELNGVLLFFLCLSAALFPLGNGIVHVLMFFYAHLLICGNTFDGRSLSMLPLSSAYRRKFGLAIALGAPLSLFLISQIGNMLLCVPLYFWNARPVFSIDYFLSLLRSIAFLCTLIILNVRSIDLRNPAPSSSRSGIGPKLASVLFCSQSIFAFLMFIPVPIVDGAIAKIALLTVFSMPTLVLFRQCSHSFANWTKIYSTGEENLIALGVLAVICCPGFSFLWLDKSAPKFFLPIMAALFHFSVLQEKKNHTSAQAESYGLDGYLSRYRFFSVFRGGTRRLFNEHNRAVRLFSFILQGLPVVFFFSLICLYFSKHPEVKRDGGIFLNLFLLVFMISVSAAQTMQARKTLHVYSILPISHAGVLFDLTFYTLFGAFATTLFALFAEYCLFPGLLSIEAAILTASIIFSSVSFFVFVLLTPSFIEIIGSLSIIPIIALVFMSFFNVFQTDALVLSLLATFSGFAGCLLIALYLIRCCKSRELFVRERLEKHYR